MHQESEQVRAVLFDLGGTLVQYYEREEFPAILEEAIASVGRYLQKRSIPLPPADVVAQATAEENHEAPDHSVRPLESRLVSIFRLGPWLDTLPSERKQETVLGMCRCFMEPVFPGREYTPTLYTLSSR